MIRQKFDKLAEKYLAGKSSPEENAFVKKWAELHFKRHSEHSVFVFEDEAQKTKERLLKKIKTTAEISERQSLKANNKLISIIAAACVIGTFIYGFYMWIIQTNMYPGVSVVGLEMKNTTPYTRKVVLPDSSIVILESGASFVAAENYGIQNRVIYLTGGAFFEVKSNDQVPFLVYSNELVTEVLGTSFYIKPENNKKTIEVSVVTGKVSVYTGNKGLDKKRIGIIATPNQKVIYNTEQKSLRNDLVDSPKIVLSGTSEPDFEFDETSLKDVLALMQRTYGIEIVLGNSMLNYCSFNGNLNGLDLYKQLDIVCEVMGMRYEIRGTTVFVTGEDCKGY